MTTITTGRVRRADIRAAVARGATFLDRAWLWGSWAADVGRPVAWWDCPLAQLGEVIDVEPADGAETAADRAAWTLDLGEGDPEHLGFWFPLAGSERLDAPLVRAWARAWRAEITTRRNAPPSVSNR